MLERVPPADHPTFESWRTATQRNQATMLRHHIETLRRLKYRPTGGFCFSWLADPSPMISASVLDDERRPKLAWQTVVDACRPVVVITDPLPPIVAPGESTRPRRPRRQRPARARSSTPPWRSRARGAAAGSSGRSAATSTPTRAPASGASSSTVPDEPGDLLLGVALTGRDDADAEVTATRRAGARIRA